MTRIFIALNCIFLTINGYAQLPSFKWVKNISGTNLETANTISLDSKGNIYTIGNFRGTPDFDPGPDTFNLTPSGASSTADMYVTKLDSSGNFIWTVAIGGTQYQSGKSIVVDVTGNIYVIGDFRGTTDFNPGTPTYNLISKGGDDFFLLKLDSTGKFIWAKSFGDYSDDHASDIILDSVGNVHVVGGFTGTVDFDPGSSTFKLTSAKKAIYVLKLKASGNFFWAKKLGGGNSDVGIGVTLDGNNNIYTCGAYSDSGDFDPGSGVFNLTSAGNSDIFISKLDSNGNFVMAISIGGAGSEASKRIRIDASGNIYHMGSFSSTLDLDPGIGTFNLTTAGQSDTYISKLNALGNFIWAVKFGGASLDEVQDMELDKDDNIYTIGQFYLTSDFDPGKDTFNLKNIGGADIFISKLDSSGDFKWARSFGSKLSDFSYGLALDPRNNIFSAGSYAGTVDFNQNGGIYNVLCKGVSDVFVHKMAQGLCYQTDASISIQACNNYTSPSGKYLWSVSNTYHDTIQNFLGCDSLITLVLTIRKSSTRTISQVACDSFVLNGITYTQTGSHKQVLTNVHGCDSTITFNLTIKKSTTGVLNQTACDSLVIHGKTYRQSGTYDILLVNKAGCDSMLKLNLTLKKSTSSILTKSACKSYTINAQTYSKSGVYVQHLTNVAGCDSSLNLTLTIDTLSVKVLLIGHTLIARDSGAVYQWLDCNDNNKPIPGMTAQSFTPTANGNYAVILTQGTCSDTSTCMQVNVSGISDNQFTGQFSVFPNPANGVFNIVLSNPTNSTIIEVYNSLGQLVYREKSSEAMNTIDLRNNAQGLYVVKVIDNNHIVSSQILIRQ